MLLPQSVANDLPCDLHQSSSQECVCLSASFGHRLWQTLTNTRPLDHSQTRCLCMPHQVLSQLLEQTDWDLSMAKNENHLSQESSLSTLSLTDRKKFLYLILEIHSGLSMVYQVWQEHEITFSEIKKNLIIIIFYWKQNSNSNPGGSFIVKFCAKTMQLRLWLYRLHCSWRSHCQEGRNVLILNMKIWRYVGVWVHKCLSRTMWNSEIYIVNKMCVYMLIW